MQLSKNFTQEEFECKCGCDSFRISDELIDGLQQLRDLIAAPIHINSGYRCESHNARVGGSKNSKHVLGIAADITCSGINWNLLYHYAENIAIFRNGGIGVYPESNFIHLDTRKEHVRWAFIDGMYTSIFEAF